MCNSLVRLQGEDESSVRDVSKRLRRRNGREKDIRGLVGTGEGIWECCGSGISMDGVSAGGVSVSLRGDWSGIDSLRGRVQG